MGCICTKPEVIKEPPSQPNQKITRSDRQLSARYPEKLSISQSLNQNARLGLTSEQGQAKQLHQTSVRVKGVSGPLPQVPTESFRRRDGDERNERSVRNERNESYPNPKDGRKDILYPNPRSGPLDSERVAHVAAGWPAWLTSVAGEAVRGWVPRRADSFEKLEKIGQGTYSNVYKARDLDTRKIIALKKVRFDNLERDSVRFMAREIIVLRRLNHPNVIKLEGLVTSRMSCSLYLVFEYMEHDLAGLSSHPEIAFTEPQVKCYLHQLLSGLEHCHTRGVLHRDIKGSNLLLDNNGILKIADFGLATFYNPEQKHPLTSRVVTLWYRPPELLLGTTEYGIEVDLWSTGCILAELLARKPIMPGRTEVEQLHKIFKLCGSPSEDYWKKSKLPHATIFKPQQPYKCCISETFKDFPPAALSLLCTLLAIEPKERGTATSAMKSEFFTTKPYACEPFSLPQYPPSKEMDAKQREEENRRQRSLAAAGKSAGVNAPSKKVASKDQQGAAVPAPDANAELQSSIKRRHAGAVAHPGQLNFNAKSKSEKFRPAHEDGAVGFLMEPPQRPTENHHNSSYIQLPPHVMISSSLSSKSGPMGPPTSGSLRIKKSNMNIEDVRMAPARPVHRVKSMSVSQSVDLAQQVAPKVVMNREKDARKEVRFLNRHRERDNNNNTLDASKKYNPRLEQFEVAEFSGSFKAGRPPLPPAFAN